MPDQTQLLDPLLVTGSPSYSDYSWQQLLDQWQSRGGVYNAPAPAPAGGGGGELLPRDAVVEILPEIAITASRPAGNPTPGAPIPEVLRTLRESELQDQLRYAEARKRQFAADNELAQKVADAMREQLWTPAPELKAKVETKAAEISSKLDELDLLAEARVRAARNRSSNMGVGIGMGLVANALMPDPVLPATALLNALNIPVRYPPPPLPTVPAPTIGTKRSPRSPALQELEVATVTATRPAPSTRASIPTNQWGASVPQMTVSPSVLDVLEEAFVTGTRGNTGTGSSSASRAATGSRSSVRSSVGSSVAGGALLGLSMPGTSPTSPSTGRTPSRVSPAPALSFYTDLGLGIGTATSPRPGDGGNFGEPPPPVKQDQCSCSEKKEKKKKSKRKPRTVCYRGTYVEKASGLSKTRREQVPCS